MAVCNAMVLAHYIVDKCTRDGEPVSNLQLQKMMYFLQTVYCRATGGELLFDDAFEAWPYGPVLSDVYTKYSDHGAEPIAERYDGADIAFCDDGDVSSFVDSGIESLRKKSPWELVRTSHAPGSPWFKVWNDGSGYKREIGNDLIKSYALRGA